MSKTPIIFETPYFLKRWQKLSSNDELEKMERELKDVPRSGDIISGSGGLRKLRWSRPGMGKRGGVRVIYYYVDERGVIILLTVYAKNEMENLPKKNLKMLSDAVKEFIKKEEK